MDKVVIRNYLKAWHRVLIRKGFYGAARKILYLLRIGAVNIGDCNDEVYESGVASWLQDNCAWRNTRYGFRVQL